jgi:hypothetical protein
MENPSFKESSNEVCERLKKQASAITDMAINSVFEDSLDMNQAVTEALES